MSDLLAEIAVGRFDPVYVLAGGDPYLVTRVVDALKEAVVPPAARSFNLDVLEPKLGAAAVVGAARTLPMMGRRRLVLVRDAETLGAEGLEGLRKYLDEPSPDAVLTLICGKVDGRMKFFQAAKKKGWLHDLVVPRQLVPWILEEARRRRVRFQPDAARRLADVVGRDLARLASAIEQLALYVSGDKAVRVDDVDELIAETRERTVFELMNAVGSGDRAGALRAVARLFDQRESAVGVAMMLARHYRQLAAARELLGERAPTAELPRLLGVPPFAIEPLLKQARRLPERGVRAAFTLLAQADRDLKGPIKAAWGERIVIERLADALCELTSSR
jgi:DNA polymerase-3 subunit delta